MLVRMTKQKNRDHHENRKVPYYYLSSVWITAVALLSLRAKVCFSFDFIAYCGLALNCTSLLLKFIKIQVYL